MGKKKMPEVEQREEAPEEVEPGGLKIDDHVFTEIVHREAAQIEGVVRLEMGAIDAVRGRFGAGRRGVVVKQDQEGVSLALELTVRSGTAVPPLARALRRRVADAVRKMTGLQVASVDIHVVAFEKPLLPRKGDGKARKEGEEKPAAEIRPEG